MTPPLQSAPILAPEPWALIADRPRGEASWEERVRWWGDLAVALREASEAGPYERFAAVVACLEASPAEAQALGEVLAATLSMCEPGRTLTDIGIPLRPTFTGELLRRLVAKIVPPVAEARELEDLLDTCLGDAPAVAWLAGLPPALLQRFAVAIGLDGMSGWPALREDAAAAIGVLAARVCADGLSDDARRAIHEDRGIQADFLRLVDVGIEVARHPAAADLAPILPALGLAVDACDHAAGHVVERMAEHAISADLVYRMERLRACLGRIRQLSGLLAPSGGAEAFHHGHAFLIQLCTARLAQTSVRGLLAEHTRLLARRVVLHAAATGNRYIAGGYAEWRLMLSAAIGGGFVMAVALQAKLGLGVIRYPAGIEWLVYGSNYAAAFAWMHLAHWTLATKQPPVTAAALAQTLGAGNRAATLDLVRRLVRSQIISVLGNLLAVGVLGTACAVLWQAATGAPLLGAEAAGRILAAHDSLGSGVLLFAAETGFVLFLSGLIQGWLANQAQGRNLARSFARASLLRHLVIAPAKRERWATAIASNLPGLGTSLALGFMLAALPVIGMITGLPCDLRHVTISAGSVSVALASLPGETLRQAGLAAIVGVLLVGTINILVGFTCALFTALRADGQPIRTALPLLLDIARDALRRPFSYVLPIDRSERPTMAMPALPPGPST